MMSSLKNMDLKKLKDKLNLTRNFTFGIINVAKPPMNCHWLQPVGHKLNNYLALAKILK